MDRILDLASDVLARNPAPALSLDELFRLVRDDAPGAALSSQSLLAGLARCPERFCIVSAAPGWRCLLGTLDRSATVRERGPRGPRPLPGSFLGTHPGPWVIGLDRATDPTGSRGYRTLRASVAYLGHRLDGESALALSRWLGLLAENARVRARLGTLTPLAPRLDPGGPPITRTRG